MKFKDLKKVIRKSVELEQVRDGLRALERGNVSLKIGAGENFTGELSGLKLVNGGVGLKAPIIAQYEAAEASIIAELEALGVTFGE